MLNDVVLLGRLVELWPHVRRTPLLLEQLLLVVLPFLGSSNVVSLKEGITELLLWTRAWVSAMRMR